MARDFNDISVDTADITAQSKDLISAYKHWADYKNKVEKESLAVLHDQDAVIEHHVESLKGQISEIAGANQQLEMQKQLMIENGTFTLAEESRYKSILVQQQNISRELSKQLEKELEILEAKKRQSEVVESYTNTLAKAMGMSRQLSDTRLGKFTTMMTGGATSKQFRENMKKMLNPLNFLASGIDNVIEATMLMFKDIMAVVPAFNRATGAAGEYDEAIMSLRQSTVSWGGSLESAAESYQALFTSMGKWSLMNKQEQAALAKSNQLMKLAGVDATTAAQAQDIFASSMGMSVEQITKSQVALNALARQMKIGPQKVFEDFVKLSPKLMSYGKDQMAVFSKLSAMAKKLSVDMGALVDITEKFDTFEGAATAVGQLNAVLGGQFLDPIEMMAAELPDRMLKMMDAINASGKDFMQGTDAQSRFMRKLVGEVTGIEDMSILSKVLGADPRELERLSNQFSSGAITQAEYMKQVQGIGEQLNANIDPFQQLQEIIKSLGVAALPIFGSIKKVVQHLSDSKLFERLGEMLSGWVEKLLPYAEVFISKFIEVGPIIFEKIVSFLDETIEKITWLTKGIGFFKSMVVGTLHLLGKLPFVGDWFKDFGDKLESPGGAIRSNRNLAAELGLSQTKTAFPEGTTFSIPNMQSAYASTASARYAKNLVEENDRVIAAIEKSNRETVKAVTSMKVYFGDRQVGQVLADAFDRNGTDAYGNAVG